MDNRQRSSLTAMLVAALALAACADDDAAEPSTSRDVAASASLVGVCPDPVVIQTDWLPEAEHGFVYQLLGSDYEVDAADASVVGPLVDAAGNDTGVAVEIRSGGLAQNRQSVTEIMYTDDSVLLGFVFTDDAIKFSATRPTIAIESGFDKNPLMIMWDPQTYPEVDTIADLGNTGAVVRYLGGAAYMDYFTSEGILQPSQVEGSYTGDPSLFVADEGEAAQQGFGSAEPYNYEHLVEGWGKPVEFQYVNDAGWASYAQSLATRPENIERWRGCFERLVPLIQRATVDYLADPQATNAVILAAVDAFGADFGWTYDAGTLDYSVRTIVDDGLVANGPDGVIGAFDMARVDDLIRKATPVYTAQDNAPKPGLRSEDIVTNEFLDPKIGLTRP